MKSKRHMKAVELKKKWHPDIVKWGVEPNHEEMEKAKKDRQFYRSGVRKYTHCAPKSVPISNHIACKSVFKGCHQCCGSRIRRIHMFLAVLRIRIRDPVPF